MRRIIGQGKRYGVLRRGNVANGGASPGLYISAYGFLGSLLLGFGLMDLEPPVLLGRGKKK